jgi:hypothetical protein
MDPLLDFTLTEWGVLCDLVGMLESSFEALQSGLVYSNSYNEMLEA